MMESKEFWTFWYNKWQNLFLLCDFVHLMSYCENILTVLKYKTKVRGWKEADTIVASRGLCSQRDVDKKSCFMECYAVPTGEYS